MSGKIGVVGKLTAKAGKEDELESMFRELSRLAKAHEPGMIQHVIFKSPDNPRVFTVVEVFADQAAFDAHSKTPHYAEVGPRLGPLIDGALGGAVEVLQVVESSS
jgi:quinol monooxygenase YgiN